jgi:hypothetical protein
LSYLLRAGAVRALTDLANARPFEEQTSERLHRFYSSLTQPFPVLRSLFAPVKDKRFASDEAEISSVIEWLGALGVVPKVLPVLPKIGNVPNVVGELSGS